MIFKDRIDAANQLAKKLDNYKNTNAIILAIPRGGIPLGHIIAKQLNLPLQIVLSKKIGHPLHKEYAIGAVTLKGLVLSDAASEVSQHYIEEETENIRKLLRKRYEDYYGKKRALDFKDKVLIIVDDGIATGNTILSTIEMLHDEKPKEIIIAIPVAPRSTLEKLQKNAFVNNVICIYAPTDFRAVGQFYQNFDQVDDSKVKELLSKTTTS